MRIKYNKSYWDNYYEGSYEETFRFSFNAKHIIKLYDQALGSKPGSFADIGAGPGQTLVEMEKTVPGIKVYGVECQDIPKDRVVHKNILWDDFLTISSKLDPVDLLYCSCSMYIPWDEQDFFLKESLRLAKKAVLFGNVYLTDRNSIPEDSERLVIYKSRESFVAALEGLGGWRCLSPVTDLFVRTSAV